MKENKYITQSEIQDQNFLSDDLKFQAKLFSKYAVFLLVATYICIWGVDYREDSMFSTTTGKIEKVKSPQGPQATD